jgi:hypothetical protein
MSRLRADDEPISFEDVTTIGEAFYGWFDFVRSWASAWSHWPVGDVTSSQVDALFFMTPKKQPYGTGGFLKTTGFAGILPLNGSQVASAFTKASREERLPVEHSLLLAARMAELRRDYRQAVIDAGTAAEVALGTAISNELHSSSSAPNYVERVIVQANGLTGLMSLYMSLGNTPGESKGKVTTGLAELRNKAAHGGYVPTSDEARLAITQSRKLVEEASPLPLI